MAHMHIAEGSAAQLQPVKPMPGHFGAAVDIGTTTLTATGFNGASGTAEIKVVDEYGYVIETITVAQAAADYQAGGQMGDINILPA